MMRPSVSPPVPRRSSVPASAGLASTAPASTVISTLLSRAFIVFRSFDLPGGILGSGTPRSEVVEAFLLHEDRHLAGGRAHAGRVDVEDVDAAADGQAVIGVEVPGGFRGRVVLLQHPHLVTREIEQP